MGLEFSLCFTVNIKVDFIYYYILILYKFYQTCGLEQGV